MSLQNSMNLMGKLMCIQIVYNNHIRERENIGCFRGHLCFKGKKCSLKIGGRYSHGGR